MFEFDLGFIGPLIVISAAMARPYILKKLNRNGTLASTVYFILIFIIGVPLYMLQGKFTLTSMDDATAKELVHKVVRQEYLGNFTNVRNVEWIAFSENQNLYTIKADITEDDKLYHIYMQPKCQFIKGCEVTLNKILIMSNEDFDVPINFIDEQTFEKRPCSDKYVKSVLLHERIKTGFKALFDNYDKVPNTTASQSIDSIKISNIQKSEATNLTNELKKLTLLNSCQATYEITGNFVMKTGDNNFMPIMELLIDEVKLVDGKYTLISKVDYNIFNNEKNELLMSAQPFNMKKFAAAKQTKKN